MPEQILLMKENNNNSTQVLDVEVLTSIGGALGLASPLVRRLLTVYRQEALKLVHGIDRTLIAGEQHELVRCAHTLKSSSASLGAEPLAAVARQIESFARNSQFAEVGMLVQELHNQYYCLLEELNRLEQQLPPSTVSPTV